MIVVSPARRPEAVDGPADPAAERFHRSLPDYRPTPLHSLEDEARRLGVGSVLLKDESDRFGLPAFKILGASWAVEQAVARRPGLRRVVAASAGNHGRAVARAASWHGLACTVFLPKDAAEDRAGAIAAEGADVVRAAGGYEAAVAEADAAGADAYSATVADVASTPGAPGPLDVTDGYATLFREAAAQAPGPIDLVLVPTGVGSLAAAAVRFAVHEQPGAHVVAVEAAAAPCVAASLMAGEPVTVPTPGTSMAGLNCAVPCATAWPRLHAGLTGALTVHDADVHAAMRELAARGLTIGDCGAAPLVALRTLVNDPAAAELRDIIGLNRASRVLLVATEGASDATSYRATVRE